MPPGKKPGECVFREIHDTTRRGEPLKACVILDARERELPPLPDEARRKYATTQLDSSRPATPNANINSFAIPFKISSPRSLAPLVKASTHEVVFPTKKSGLPRPKLHLQTGWDSLQHLVRLHPADDLPWRSASQQSLHSTTSQDHLHSLSPLTANRSHLHHASGPSIRDAKSKLSRPPTAQERSTPCRFLAGARLPKVAAVVRAKAVTSRRIDESTARILAKPFIRSDAGPLHGITVTVHRQRLVSEPIPAPILAPRAPQMSPSNTTSTAPAMKEKPLPTRARDLGTRDLPAIPVLSDDQPEAADADPTLACPTASSPSSSPTPIAPPPAIVHMGRPPSGAKRRKHYRVPRVPVPRA